ncbi:MAG: MATE family efflux transporter [Tissierellia bacterium]|nr:MATE family efflux transporter [Tissierellia bacterium]
MEKRYMLEGPVIKSILTLSVPLFISNLLQQFYNIADTIIVGRFIGPDALAAVGSSFTFMIFITSIIYGLSLGSSSVFSMKYGRKDFHGLKKSIYSSFILIFSFTIFLNLLAYLFIDRIIIFMNAPLDIGPLMKEYLLVIFSGFIASSLYNYVASIHRSMGDSKTPMIFLANSVILNIILDYIFIKSFSMGIFGAAIATVISQYISAIGIFILFWIKNEDLRFHKGDKLIDLKSIKEIANFSIMTSIQQSVMNFGILMIQGLVNSFGANTMAAFAAAVKIDAFAYMPVQDFGNAFSIFVAQNFGAGNKKRIREGFKKAIILVVLFSLLISMLVFAFAESLILIFLDEANLQILEIGKTYLRTEGAFYFAIAILFLLYGYYRAVAKPAMSIVLTILSLGTRVLLAYKLASIPHIGTSGIWWAIVIGWFLADSFGLIYYFKTRRYL